MKLIFILCCRQFNYLKINATWNAKKLFAKKIHADNRMHPKLTEFADIPWGTGVLYQVKLLGSKGLKEEDVLDRTKWKNYSHNQSGDPG